MKRWFTIFNKRGKKRHDTSSLTLYLPKICYLFIYFFSTFWAIVCSTWLLCTRSALCPTSPLYNGEISVSVIYRRIHFAVVQRRDFSLFYIQTHSLCRCTTARFQSLLYTDADAFTSPLYNGEISVSFIYRRIHFAVVQRRDFSVLYIQRHLPGRCTTAR